MATRRKTNLADIEGIAVQVSGIYPRIARLRSEQFTTVEDPHSFIPAVKANVRADIFSFIQPVGDHVPRHSYHQEWVDFAVLHFDSYESWWKDQLNDKTRNMIRKAAKKGIEVRTVICDDALIEGIKEIYDETPVRQGKPFKHYGKDLATLRNTHATLLERSEFIGAFFQGKLVGFIKIVYQKRAASIMQIISTFAHRDKAPTNALLAKAVELCAKRGIHLIQYGIWSRRSMGEFKRHHCFERVRVPRYFVPLNARGSFALLVSLHRNLVDLVPENLLNFGARLRAWWYERKLVTG